MTHHHHVISHCRIASYLISSHLVSYHHHSHFREASAFVAPLRSTSLFLLGEVQENFCKRGTSRSFTCASQRQNPFRIFLRVARVDAALDAVRIERSRRLAGTAGTAVPATSVTAFCFTPYRTRLADLTDVQLRLRRALFSAWR